MSLRLWRLNPITGLWSVARAVTAETASEWLAIWRKDEPGVEFKVSKNKPPNPFMKGV